MKGGNRYDFREMVNSHDFLHHDLYYHSRDLCNLQRRSLILNHHAPFGALQNVKARREAFEPDSINPNSSTTSPKEVAQ